jgi:AhpC/TSA family
MKKLLLLSLVFALNAQAGVVHPAPNFSYPTVGKQAATLKGAKGQAVVMIIAERADSKAVKKQLRYLEAIYQQFASKQVIFVAALKDPAAPIQSNIPFVLANNAPGVAAAYGATDAFTLVIIGKDGNLDYQTTKVCTGERVRDVIQN